VKEKGEKREEERRETKREEGEREGRRERERERGDSKILKEKQSQVISCFHERLFHAKISIDNPTKSIKIQFIKQSFKI